MVVLDDPVHYLKCPEELPVSEFPDSRHRDQGKSEQESGYQGGQERCRNQQDDKGYSNHYRASAYESPGACRR